MNINQKIKAALLLLGMANTIPAFATTTYLYTDTANNTFSGSFSVDSALANGVYNFLSTASQPAGFTENFFVSPFVDKTGVTRITSLTAFDVTVNNGQVTAWDIVATAPLTIVTRPANYNVYHAAHLIYTASTFADTTTYYYDAIPYQISPSGINTNGVWSGGGLAVTTAVPEPDSFGMMLAGLGLVGFIVRRSKVEHV